MSTLRIDNKSDDDILVLIDGSAHELRNGESVSVDRLEKGAHEVIFHRRRIPKESVSDENKKAGLEALMSSDEKPGSHIQLSSSFLIDINSSKSSIAVFKKVKAVENYHEDVIFVSFSAQVTGAKTLKSVDKFANNEVKKTYFLQQLKGAFLPVGLVGLAVVIIGIIAAFFLKTGVKITVGGRVMTAGYAYMVLSVGIIINVYFIINVIRIIKRVKELS